jgi:hypothetical protein
MFHCAEPFPSIEIQRLAIMTAFTLPSPDVKTKPSHRLVLDLMRTIDLFSARPTFLFRV